MKRKNFKDQNRLLHHLLDSHETSLDGSAGSETERFTRYRESLKRLETHREKAPDNFTIRIMAALPENPRLTWVDRLKLFWPERRFWPIPTLAGAVATLFLVAALTLFRAPSNTRLIPVVLDFYAPSAKKVELVGTFSDWTPGVFSLKGPDAVGYWAIAVKLPPGRYEYAFLINGSKLVPDDDGESLRPDGFGGENSVLLLRAALQKVTRPVIAASFGQTNRLPSLPEKNRPQWQPVMELGLSGGLSQDQLEPLLSSMAAAGINPDQACAFLVPLLKNGIIDTPADHLFLKVREGILKQAHPDNLKFIFAKRESAFEQAKTLLTKTDRPLLFTAAFALESGLDPSSLNEVLIAGKEKPSSRVTAVIEAGEMLHHAGLEPGPLKLIMVDCLLKDLNSQQIKRVTERVKAKLHEGSDSQTIYNELWV